MLLSELDYELPPELIACRPPERRDGGRLMVVQRVDTPDEGVAEQGVAHEAVPEKTISHHQMGDWVEMVPRGAVVVLNDTRVIPARLHGQKVETGGRVEFLLVEPTDVGDRWRALGKASKRLKVGVVARCGALLVEVVEETDEQGMITVLLSAEGAQGVDQAIRQAGTIPLPPYLGREPEASDDERYQTVFAAHDGAVAAPTAGLHLTRDGLRRLKTRGVEIVYVTLHVGPGTFRPVKVADLNDHPMHVERYEVSAAAAASLGQAKEQGRRIIAVGTTVVRTLESCFDAGVFRVGPRRTDLLIQPGYAFRVVDGLLTNFHLPGSTLLALVGAFGGTERVRRAYETAIDERYRFYSYGDAMYLPARDVGSTRSRLRG